MDTGGEQQRNKDASDGEAGNGHATESGKKNAPSQSEKYRPCPPPQTTGIPEKGVCQRV
jgi:hypothetical protein